MFSRITCLWMGIPSLMVTLMRRDGCLHDGGPLWRSVITKQPSSLNLCFFITVNFSALLSDAQGLCSQNNEWEKLCFTDNYQCASDELRWAFSFRRLNESLITDSNRFLRRINNRAIEKPARQDNKCNSVIKLIDKSMCHA